MTLTLITLQPKTLIPKVRQAIRPVLTLFAVTLLILPNQTSNGQDASRPRLQVQEAQSASFADTKSSNTDASKAEGDTTKPGEWMQLFNGKDLSGWTPKIRYHDLGDNYANTFRVEDGLLKVRYDADKYEKFGEKFGHIFYEKPFSHYRLRVEYRFVGEQANEGPGWALRNSGMMLHCEDPKLMTKDQDFPISIEYQLLGGDGKNTRTTANLCTPGTNVVYNGQLHRPHCTSSTSKTYHGEQWVTAEVEVHGDGTVKHIMDGEVVLEYSNPQLDFEGMGAEHAKWLVEEKGATKELKGGYISLQSESHPIDFRKVELMVLEDESEK